MDASEVLEAQLKQLQSEYSEWLRYTGGDAELQEKKLKDLEVEIDLIHIRIKTNKIKLE